MKKISLAFLGFSAFCAVSLASCDKIKDTLFPAFNAELDEVAVTIPVTLAGAEGRVSQTISFNLDSIIKTYTANAFGIGNLSSVKVKDITVTLVNTDVLNNFSNFETVRITLASNAVATPVVVAGADIPNTAATSINLTPSVTPELKEYLAGNQLIYTVTAKARRTTTKPLDAAVHITLAIK